MALLPLAPGAPGGDDTVDRVARGGGWNSVVEECRSAYRWNVKFNMMAKMVLPKNDIGFRICVER